MIKDLGGARVKFVILYGSVSKNTQLESSDIDICVYYDDESMASDFRFRFYRSSSETSTTSRSSSGFLSMSELMF